MGQIDLMYAYREMFRWVELSVGQILLSAEDFRDRARYKNLQNTIKAMLARKIVPIINENDSLAVAEIKVGDNDKLSSDVALFLDADLLLIFTDEDGLFDDNPKKNPNARLLNFVPEITPAIFLFYVLSKSRQYRRHEEQARSHSQCDEEWRECIPR